MIDDHNTHKGAQNIQNMFTLHLIIVKKGTKSNNKKRNQNIQEGQKRHGRQVCGA